MSLSSHESINFDCTLPRSRLLNTSRGAGRNSSMGGRFKCYFLKGLCTDLLYKKCIKFAPKKGGGAGRPKEIITATEFLTRIGRPRYITYILGIMIVYMPTVAIATKEYC